MSEIFTFPSVLILDFPLNGRTAIDGRGAQPGSGIAIRAKNSEGTEGPE